jgi:hypothetical protein
MPTILLHRPVQDETHVTPGTAGPKALIDRSVPLVDRLLRLTRIPGVRGAVNDLVGLIRSIKP